MISDIKYIAPDIEEKIKQADIIEEVIGDYVVLQQRGKQLRGDCPCCGAKKKFEINVEKKIWKCWVCDEAGKTGISYLMKAEGKSYREALEIVAAKYNIALEEQDRPKKKRGNRRESFRDRQLRDSGISEKSQKYFLSKDSSTKYEHDRYQAATVDAFWNVIPGDDMVLNYLNLNGEPMTYLDPKGKRQNLVRVRWANPSIHKNKDGKAGKYKSPYGSGSQIWIPNFIIDQYQKHQILKTLYVIEGEKKADAMCEIGIPAVGVMGIQNFSSSNEMPYDFQLLIKRCGIANVVFLLDADWQKLSLINPEKPVESRPNNFYKAVLKFRDYFKAYYLEGYELNIFFGYGKDMLYKGMDDLIVRNLQEKKTELQADLEKAMQDRNGEGEWVNVHNITEMSSYKLKEYWYLQSRPKFFHEHKEELMKLREFKFGKLTYRYNKEEGDFEMSQKVLPHEEFWHGQWDDKQGKMKYSFNYVGILEFLKNRGYGMYKKPDGSEMFVHIENRIVREVNHNEIQRYVLDFTRDMTKQESLPILEMLLRGGKQYLGPDKLTNMHFMSPQFNRSTSDEIFLYFKNCYWKITKDDIVARPLAELPRHIWDDSIIDFEPTLRDEPLLKVERKNNDWKIKKAADFHKCDIASFNMKTSSFHWKKVQEMLEDEDGNFYFTDRTPPEKIEKEDLMMMRANLMAKVLATGYLAHDFLDYANMKAVIAMDFAESEVGRSQGGTGKGVWCSQFEQLMPVHWINGKRRALDEDKYLYAGVDERTRVIWFEDVRVNFDFEQLFPTITKATSVEKKGVDATKEEPKKVLIDTNHALNGDGNSFRRRQYFISFSDYYNRNRTVRDDFGHQFYHEWDFEQYNQFFNWIANCCQIYLRYKLSYEIPQTALDRRKLRQKIGENFLEFAHSMFHTEPDSDGRKGRLINVRFGKTWGYEKYIEKYPTEKRYMTTKAFKRKLIDYADYARLALNPILKDGETRIMSNGEEYFILADKEFNANDYRTVATEHNFQELMDDDAGF